MTTDEEIEWLDILRIVQKLRNRFKDEDCSLRHLSHILFNGSMQALLRLHESVRRTIQSSDGSLCINASSLVKEVHSYSLGDDRLQNQMSSELCQLSDLFLSSPHLVAILQCHDEILKKNFEPELPDLNHDDLHSQYEDESLKVVRLMKGNEPLGATIAVDELTSNIVIARILKGGAADRSGLVHANDILVEINNVPTRGKTPEDLIHQLANFRGPLTFCLIPAESHLPLQNVRDEEMFVRAKVDYNPDQDFLIPCREAGLHYRNNDVLHILLRDDELWWQAAVAEDGIHSENISSLSNVSLPIEKRAGLIPSSRLQSRRKTLKSQSTTSSRPNEAGSNVSLSSKSGRKNAWSLLRQSFRHSKGLFEGGTIPRPLPKSNVHTHGVCIPNIAKVYEEVALFLPPSLQPREEQRFRPLVLVGPQGVGRNVLKDRLIDSNPAHYGVPIPHTSREKLPGEEDGKDYHYVTREFMESGIHKDLFLEYGEYKSNTYGTSLSAVNDVIADNQVCVLTPYPQALELLWNSDLKPFIIFVKPPLVKETIGRQHTNETKLTIDRNMSTPLSFGDLEDLTKRARKIETIFGHYFDYTIVNDDIDRAFGELSKVAYSVENKKQWIPKTWV